MTISNILEDVADYLQYRREEGDVAVEVDPAVVSRLQAACSGIKASAQQEMRTATMTRQNETPPASAPAPGITANEPDSISAITDEIAACTLCALHKTRNRTVPGQGNPSPEIMFVGEAPGADEDAQGLAFVGRAGKLLTRMLENLGLSREEVFIANILKCRPPDNRTPLPDEIELCRPYLERQIKLLKPKAIVALGGTAVRGLLGDETPISKIRGRWMTYQNTPLMPTFHPSYLLRNQKARWDVWADMLEVLKHTGHPLPPSTKT